MWTPCIYLKLAYIWSFKLVLFISMNFHYIFFLQKDDCYTLCWNHTVSNIAGIWYSASILCRVNCETSKEAAAIDVCVVIKEHFLEYSWWKKKLFFKNCANWYFNACSSDLGSAGTLLICWLKIILNIYFIHDLMFKTIRLILFYVCNLKVSWWKSCF